MSSFSITFSSIATGSGFRPVPRGLSFLLGLVLLFSSSALAGNDCNGNGVPDALDIKKGTECNVSHDIDDGEADKRRTDRRR